MSLQNYLIIIFNATDIYKLSNYKQYPSHTIVVQHKIKSQEIYHNF